MRTNNEKNFYFRSEKNSYQQGEQISIVGKPIIQTEKNNEGYIHVYSNDSLINTKQLLLIRMLSNYEGKFWASQSGRLDYEIEIFDQENSRIVSRGRYRYKKVKSN